MRTRWATAAASLVCLVAVVLAPSAAHAQSTWTQLPMPPGIPRDQPRDLVFSSRGEMYVSYDTAGLWRSPDFGTTWQSVQFNVPAATVGGYFAFNTAGEIVYSATDAIWRLPAGATRWTRATITGSFAGAEVNLFLVRNRAGDLICGTSGLQFLRSTDGGGTFTAVSRLPISGGLFSLGANPVTLDLYAGTEVGPEYQSSDGTTWTSIGRPGGDVRIGFNRLGEVFGETTHGGTLGGVLARYVSGATWVRSDVGLPMYADTRSFGLAPSGAMFAGSADVYGSRDDGRTWSQAGLGMPSCQVKFLRVGPDGNLYAGAQHATSTSLNGVWRLPLGAVAPPPDAGAADASMSDASPGADAARADAMGDAPATTLDVATPPPPPSDGSVLDGGGAETMADAARADVPRTAPDAGARDAGAANATAAHPGCGCAAPPRRSDDVRWALSALGAVAASLLSRRIHPRRRRR